MRETVMVSDLTVLADVLSLLVVYNTIAVLDFRVPPHPQHSYIFPVCSILAEKIQSIPLFTKAEHTSCSA